MTELVPSDVSDIDIAEKLDNVRRELGEATDDWVRIKIRDEAQRLKKAAEVMNRRDIEVLGC